MTFAPGAPGAPNTQHLQITALEEGGRGVAGRVPALDGLRGLAIALVLMMHAVNAPAFWWGSAVNRVARTGWIGVDLFFVLSGFLITGILLDTKGRMGYYRSFYTRRVLRIFPLYYGFLALVLLAPGPLSDWLGAPYLSTHQPWFWSHTVNWLIVGEGANGDAVAAGFGALWSLSIEEQFYLLWPVLVAVTSRRGLGLALTGLLVGGTALRFWLATHGADVSTLYHMTVTRLDPLVLGALLALLQREGGLARARVPWSLGVCAVTVGALGVVWVAGSSPYHDELIFAITVPIVAAGWGCVLLLTLVRENQWTRWMRTPTLRWLGKYSYAIYLLSPAVSHVLQGAGYRSVFGPTSAGVVRVAVTLAAAYASWHLLEKHALALKGSRPTGGPVQATRPRA